MTYINKGIEMKKNQMKPVAQEKSTHPIVPNNADWGVEINKDDLLMPRILMMQKMSDLVEEQKAKAGELVDSLTEEVLCGPDETLEIIPFHSETIYKEMHNGEFHSIVPYTQKMAHEEMVNGVKIESDLVIQVFVLIPQDGLDDIPYVISFKRTSRKAGQKIVTQFYRNSVVKQPPCAVSWKLTTKKVSGDKGAYHVYDVTKSRKTTQEEMAKAFIFNQAVLSGKRKVDYAVEEDRF